ncbi:copper homeostasis protein CutC [Albibacterium bauzanense]|uniref:PF03932 family protein CutC n=1 Tax=Albibacterium bauzanense TaxID=653929 RepID=A0A4R1M1K4_9SPHI|nr:copper homeostasis protein CutC [Albibacterium bauzanense]TCK85555.1 copper homeostasis protein [Albibacterium bauzanense]
MRNKAVLEVCAFHIDSCIIAERCGALRVELCDNPIEGGTTPSYGTIKQVREKISIKLYPLLRPRSGNYFYSDEEFDILKDDIEICKQLGCDGISVGVSKINAEIDTERLKRIVEWAGPMGVTCNRVFDCSPDPFKALEDIIDCGCERVLTSGQKSTANDAAYLLKQLVQQADGRIIIMPGAGVNSSNILNLKNASGAMEFHSSARKIAPNPVTYINKEVSDYGNVYIADETEVKAMIDALNN